MKILARPPGSSSHNRPSSLSPWGQDHEGSHQLRGFQTPLVEYRACIEHREYCPAPYITQGVWKCRVISETKYDFGLFGRLQTVSKKTVHRVGCFLISKSPCDKRVQRLKHGGNGCCGSDVLFCGERCCCVCPVVIWNQHLWIQPGIVHRLELFVFAICLRGPLPPLWSWCGHGDRPVRPRCRLVCSHRSPKACDSRRVLLSQHARDNPTNGIRSI